MPTSEADTTLSAETAAQSTTTDGLTYQSILGSANEIWVGFVERIPYFVASIIVILIFWFLSIVFKKIVHKLLGSRSRHQNLVKVFQRVGGALIFFIGFMIAMVIAVPGFTPAKLIGALGIGSVAIGFAFKDIFQNLLSGILLLISEPFRIGDQIVSGDYEGTVEDIKIRATTIRTYDGRQVVIPNSDLYTSALTVNTAYKQRRLQVAVGIGYEDDIEAAKAEIIKALDKIESVSKKATPSVIATGFGGSSIDLMVRWFIEDGTQANKVASIHQVIVGIKNSLDAAGVNIPFPIRTIDLSDPSVSAIVNKMNEQQDVVDVNKTVAE
ncbi:MULTISPECIES: mechanosensitive ion channel family protein [Psychrobacter]|jgi:small-conductance mechanosensitive channel|uniref:mechanosensitive ion channel family protein n=1 Tax=Psychrobacter TaxID=497 RepID=UPI000C34EB0E|nr:MULTISPECIES: mechanosensitive ion channel domain-containing protein [Psychrobacter]MBA6244061.1 mechanosensitive ion channel [Psychrobacter sp. Urea-trap-18]MBA6287277.1 mechanosensitive ion channel [Psychrobacter sp. Urea-trap-16]MBA6318391.1 mechanosensitive ion channel [Psychrobacter sp. Urea-trap-20]MBA6335335.1 mechanosensitive ion channel [Psychrobacter sp. Urea-trap-19]MCG3842838.1 mechanosensitive ion channel [Psychrobacter sp. Ps1]